MKKLRIGYFADGPWSHEAFKILVKDETIEFKFICVRFDTQDDKLKGFSERYNIDYIKDKNINSEKFIKKLLTYECDLFISMSFNQIFKAKVIEIPKNGVINCHAGKLPFYRGRNVLNWVLINDEKEFGITVHFVDEGIDTGDIILQKVYPISDEDDYNSLLNLAYIECSKLLYQAVKLLQRDEYTRIKQKEIHPIGFYCGGRQAGDEVINWNQNSREIFNFIRAICKPGPGGRSFINNNEIIIYKARCIENAPIYKGIPGQVIGSTQDGFFVKTQDSFLEIVDYEYENKVMVGDRLKKSVEI